MSSYQGPVRASLGAIGRVGDFLRRDLVGGALLVSAAALGISLANSPAAGAYQSLSSFTIGPAALGLDLSLEYWAADALLALFFFLVGLELKREFVTGELRNPKTALVPIVAAIGGVIVPAGIFLALTVGDRAASAGWAIPVATDIAFAVAVLALLAPNLPSAVRLFLLTLAVVDDLIGIVLIAIISAKEVNVLALGLALIPLAVFAVLAHRYRAFFTARIWASWLILLPLGLVVWALVFHSGIHATIAGVALGLVVPVLARDGSESRGLAHSLEHHLRPLSAGFAVPVFAFFAAGVTISGRDGFGELAGQPVFWAVAIALVLGKPIGIAGFTWLITRFRFAYLHPSIHWIDLLGMSVLAGIGFTVSLLITAISFEPGSPLANSATLGVLIGSVVAALIAALILIPRNRHYVTASRKASAEFGD